MSPIERAEEKRAALQSLGLNDSAGPDEIRAAWRRIARETHPDRAGGSLEDFVSAKAAYDLLTTEERAPQEPARREPVRPSRPERAGMGARPKATGRTMEFDEAVLAECRALFGDGTDAADAAADHLPSGVNRQGRTLTYIVATPLRKGTNRVSVPSAVLEDHRKVRPQIVSFRSTGSGPAEIVVPDGLREKLFPGAKSVMIRFGVTDAARSPSHAA